MPKFDTRALETCERVSAPDGSEVRPLLRFEAGSMAHFSLAAGRTSLAVAHDRVEELWYILSGEGEMWRRGSGREEVVPLQPGVALSIPAGTAFQFRSGDETLCAVAITIPRWPDEGDAHEVAGPWTPDLDSKGQRR